MIKIQAKKNNLNLKLIFNKMKSRKKMMINYLLFKLNKTIILFLHPRQYLFIHRITLIIIVFNLYLYYLLIHFLLLFNYKHPIIINLIIIFNCHHLIIQINYYLPHLIRRNRQNLQRKLNRLLKRTEEIKQQIKKMIILKRELGVMLLLWKVRT